MPEEISFKDKVECLVAKREPVIVALYQPRVDLTTDGNEIPHYTDKHQISAKLKSFFELARSNGAHLIIVPEYGTPEDILFQICRTDISLPNGTLSILPLEPLTLDRYRSLHDEIEGIEHCQIKWIDVTDSPGHDSVNVCAIIAIIDGTKRVFLQPKRHPADLENTYLCKGKDYFLFIGDGLAMSSLICSDAHDNSVFKEQISRTRKSARGIYIIHTQWNPSSLHDMYNHFWASVISGEKASFATMLISNNVSNGSEIATKNLKVEIPSVRIACSGNGEPSHEYMGPSQFLAFKSLFENEYGQIMNLVCPDDGAHIISIRRPYQNVTHAADETSVFVELCKTFKYTDSYIEVSMAQFLESLKQSLNLSEDNINKILTLIASFTPEDIEKLISSALMREKYAWLDQDILSRPLIWACFYKNISHNEESFEAFDLFNQCIEKLLECKDKYDYLPFKFSEVDMYPINLIKTNNQKDRGWLFHCKGMNSTAICQRIARIFKKLEMKGIVYVSNLFPISCNGEISKKMINIALNKVDDPTDSIGSVLDICDPRSPIDIGNVITL